MKSSKSSKDLKQEQNNPYRDAIERILKNYGYQLEFTPQHRAEDIAEFAENEKNVDRKEYFTIFNERGYVICRLQGIEKKTKIERQHIEVICDTFRMFDILYRDEIIEELEVI